MDVLETTVVEHSPPQERSRNDGSRPVDILKHRARDPSRLPLDSPRQNDPRDAGGTSSRPLKLLQQAAGVRDTKGATIRVQYWLLRHDWRK